MTIHHVHTVQLHPHLGITAVAAIVLAGMAIVVWSRKQ